jgi:predicted transglutaminase-like cysteine proteinase
MIAEILPEAYDIRGKRLRDPGQKRFKFFSPKFPLGRHIKDPPIVQCKNLKDIRNFLNKCRYVSDLKQFGVEDYWMPPELFEQKRQGDCEDFALWVWRQLIVMGKQEPRFVTGILQPNHLGHAWVTFMEGNRGFLIEATTPRLSSWLPRLQTTKYVPVISVAWEGAEMIYYEHVPRRFKPSLGKLIFLKIETIFFWLKTRPRYCYGWIRYWLYLFYAE